MIDPSLRNNSGSAATPIRVILPVLMLAVFTISLGFEMSLPQLPALVERLSIGRRQHEFAWCRSP